MVIGGNSRSVSSGAMMMKSSMTHEAQSELFVAACRVHRAGVRRDGIRRDEIRRDGLRAKSPTM